MAFEQQFEKKVRATIEKHKLLKKTDKIIVACSGGKDSTTILYLLNKWGYDVEGLMIDLHIGAWSKKNLGNLKQVCDKHDIKLHTVDIREAMGGSMCFIHSQVQSKEKLNNCTICGIIKRWILNKETRELKADKIVTGHNINDEAESVLMNLFRKTMRLAASIGPNPGIITDKKFIPRIKPLYYCLNSEVRRYSELKGFPVEYAPCPCSADVFRRNIRSILNDLEKTDPKIKENIVMNFLKVIPKLKDQFKNEKKQLKYCRLCGEPSVNTECQTCRMMKLVKS